ncbi:hypothetical protein [Bacillus sp. FJAT-29814]|uniref:hypothetical protein n=1 Tax=Bacillus sp. FJAT-29814 TaxID=1729688 RepID=UPI00082D2496|nr:hypothetical protein [Bacillus sp. FJAT-29814]
MDDVFLVFIGDVTSSKEWTVSRKPNFSDAIKLSHQSASLTNSSYQYIPLRDIEKEPIYFCNMNFHITFNQYSLKVESECEVPEAEIFEALGHFVVQEGPWVSFLLRYPVHQTCFPKRIKVRNLSAAKQLRESDERKVYGKIRVKI